MAATILMTLFVYLPLGFAVLALIVGIGGAALFTHEAMLDHHRHAAPRSFQQNLENFSFLDE